MSFDNDVFWLDAFSRFSVFILAKWGDCLANRYIGYTKCLLLKPIYWSAEIAHLPRGWAG